MKKGRNAKKRNGRDEAGSNNEQELPFRAATNRPVVKANEEEAKTLGGLPSAEGWPGFGRVPADQRVWPK